MPETAAALRSSGLSVSGIGGPVSVPADHVAPLEGYAGAPPFDLRLNGLGSFGGGKPRAAPGGTGAAKCAGNYAASLVAQQEAIANGCEQVAFVDAVERRWVEELGGMNLFFVHEDGLIVTPELPPDATGGIGAVAASIAPALAARGHDVHILYCAPHLATSDSIDAGVQVHRRPWVRRVGMGRALRLPYAASRVYAALSAWRAYRRLPFEFDLTDTLEQPDAAGLRQRPA